MRSKEEAQDYRFISDPDLPAMIFTKKKIENIKKTIPETPQEKLEKLIKKHKIEKSYAETLIKKLEIAELFEKLLENKINPKIAARWVTEELLSVLNYNKKELEEISLNPEHFIELLKLIENKTLTELKAKDILRTWKETSESPKQLLKSSTIISDESNILNWIKKAIKENPKAVEDYKSGQQQALNFLIGNVMKFSDKRADYSKVKKLLEKELK